MTDNQKYLAELLMTGDYYLREINHAKKRKAWKLMDLENNPIKYVTPGTVKKYKHILKKDKIGRYSFNLNLVRQENSNAYVKQLYKKKQMLIIK